MPPPRGGGRLLRNLSDNYAHSGALNGTENLSAEEQLLAGTLELDPENDPVIFTTDYGLEIKSHNAGGSPISSTGVDIADATTTVSSTTWHYISAGGYNWIIIGSYSSNTYELLSGNEYPGNNPDGTDAGNAVEEVNANGVLKTNVIMPIFSNAVVPANGEIPFGCVLCLCAGNITTTKFNASSSDGNNYSGSNLEDYMNNTVYGSDSTLSTALQALPIVPQDLTTLYYSGTTTITDAYVFPLAGRGASESFYVETYLNSTTKRATDAFWWLRSGHASIAYRSYYVLKNGTNHSGDFVTDSLGVRPAFVLQLCTFL